MKIFAIASALAFLAVRAAAGEGGSEDTTDVQPAPPAPQDEAPPWAENELHWYWKDGLRFESADGAFAFELGGRIQLDAGFFDADDENEAIADIEDGAEFRRARIALEGLIHERWSFKAQYDFAGGDVDFNDVYLGYERIAGSGVNGVVGHFKEPIGFDELTSSKYITFMERALPVSAFSPSRNLGVAFSRTLAGEAATATIGVFTTDTSDAGISMEDGGYAVTARLAGSPLYEDGGRRLVHVGGSYSLRDPEDEMASFGTRPEAHLLPSSLLTTGDFEADDVEIAGLELGAVLGPFHAAAEYLLAMTDGPDDADLDGWYVQAGWFLTGESRPYKRSAATWDKVKPADPLGSGGFGALELAARYSTVDLSDGPADGGDADNVTVGVNWYPNTNVRLMANYVLADLDTPDFDGELDAFMLRFQVWW